MTTVHRPGAPDATTAPGASGDPLARNPYGLTLREARAEIRRCTARGWLPWEIRLRFANDCKDTIE